METKVEDLLPFVGDARERRHGGAHEDGDAGDLGRRGEERGHRRRRALVDVRRPHVERHRRNLEAEADEQEHQPEHQADAGAALRRQIRDFGDAGEADRAGEAVDQRGAVEQHARRQRAQHEILQARFRRLGAVAVEGGDDVERERHQLEAEIKRDQVGRRDQQQHAERRQQEQRAVFELLLLLELQDSPATTAARRPSRPAPGSSETARSRRARSCRRTACSAQPAAR